jgi:Protein of unknown function (DUF3106)
LPASHSNPFALTPSVLRLGWARGWLLFGAVVSGAVLALSGPLKAQTTENRSSTRATPAPQEVGSRWRELTRVQRQSLQPLENVWNTISADRKLKWIEIAQRIPQMPDDERARVQLRMAEWVMLGPAERGLARLNFQEAKQINPELRQAQWKAYQALSEEEKRQLAESRKVPPSSGAPTASMTSGSRSAKLVSADKKSKIIANPTFALPPTPIAPTLVHPSFGATTTLLTKKPSPPAHQQVGLPKIMSTPEFVDPKTLLPRRGPQAAATYTATASTEPLARP